MPSWSPDGTQLACWGYGTSCRKDAGIYVLDAATGAQTRILSSTSASAPS